MRVIVTGSRTLAESYSVLIALDSLVGLTVIMGQHLTVVHGACPQGADRHVADWCRTANPQYVTEEKHPADWRLFGRSAGPVRNREMAQMGADLVLAFWDGKSSGTRGMIEQAVIKGIPVIAKRFTLINE